MKKYFCLALLSLSFFISADSPNYSKPLCYNFITELSSKSLHSFNFNFTQQIDLQCKVDSISPIDQTPEKITLTFKRIQGEAQYNEKKLKFDSLATNNYSLEFQSLKKLIDQPISIDLNRDMSVQGPLENFKQLLHLSSLEDHFINSDLLEQILEAIFIPLKAKASPSQYPTSIYFPFKTKANCSIHLKESPSIVQLHLDQALELEGLYSTEAEPFSIHLTGKLKGEGKWHPKQFYAREFSLRHDLKERAEETFFESPLIFDYAINLNLIQSND